MVASVQVDRLIVEHYRSALGIGETAPRLSWRLSSSDPDWTQAAYEIRIQRSGATEETDEEQYHVESDNSVLVPWPSQALQSRERANIRVQVYGADGSISPWSVLEIEVGILSRSDWSAALITCPAQDLASSKRPFRLMKTFTSPPSIERARLYVTGYGCYEMYINGKRVGDEILAPGWTQYEANLVYRTHDITELVLPGQENSIGAWIGEGWYAGRLGFGGGRRNIWGSRPALLAQIEVNGQSLVITDESWSWSYGQVVQSSIYDGEVFDSNLEDGWKDGAGQWASAESIGTCSVVPTASQAPPVREVERITPVAILTTPGGKSVVDFGQNFAGYVQLREEPPSGDEVVLSHAEVLEHGELGLRPLRTAKCRDIIKLGGAVSGYKPRFTFHGFRYVQVDGWQGLSLQSLVGIVLSTDMERLGHFDCSHALLNRLHANVVYSAIANSISLPTDCPQRDERLGWTGDVQVFAPTLSFLFDTTGFLSGWLRDLSYEQTKANGIVPIVIPALDANFNLPSAVWGDVAALLPASLYLTSGDIGILEKQYDSMVLWLDKGVQRDPDTRLWDTGLDQFGDWLAPQPEGSRGTTDIHLVADAYLVHVTRVVAEISDRLHRYNNARRFTEDAHNLLKSFQETYITPRHRTVSDTQSALALILHFDLLDPDKPQQRTSMVQRLEMLVQKCLWQVSTGFAGTPLILHVLAENDMLHHAYRMLQAKDSPSWLAPVLLGATTIWERFDSMLQDGSINPDEMTSFNHYALGSVAEFLHKVVGGISPIEPGWRKILVKPRPGGTVTSASVSHVSPYGRVSCAWKILDDTFEAVVDVPPNCSACIDLPGPTTLETVGSGRWNFKVVLVPDERFPPKLVRSHYLPPVNNTFVS